MLDKGEFCGDCYIISDRFFLEGVVLRILVGMMGLGVGRVYNVLGMFLGWAYLPGDLAHINRVTTHG